jgi:hypothetical protein
MANNKPVKRGDYVEVQRYNGGGREMITVCGRVAHVYIYDAFELIHDTAGERGMTFIKDSQYVRHLKVHEIVAMKLAGDSVGANASQVPPPNQFMRTM